MAEPAYWPLPIEIVSEWPGDRGGWWHYGTDFAVPENTPLVAAFDGEVVFAGGDGASGQINGVWANGEGLTVDILRSDGLRVRYGHMNRIDVVVGEVVKAGDGIGLSGNTGFTTGPHCHVEFRWDSAWSGGAWVDPRTLGLRPISELNSSKKKGGDVVTPISYQDRKTRTIKRGNHTWLRRKNQSRDSEANNIVGAPGTYSITGHVQAENLQPGDVIVLTLVRQNTKYGLANMHKHSSPHYEQYAVAGQDGKIRESVEWKLGTTTGDMIFLAARVEAKNKSASARITLIDSDGYLFG